jgi:hypothetical protein
MASHLSAHTPVADSPLLTRLSREAIPTGTYFRTRTPAGARPLTSEQQHHNLQLLATASSRTQTAPDHDRTPLRCLTIRPPWSDLIAIEDDRVAKRIENRVWNTRWRGTLLIHAGAEVDLRATALPYVRARLDDDYELVRGSVVAVADLTGIHDDDGPCSFWSDPGCFHWELARVQRLTTPVPARGAQRLWRPTPKLLRQITDANPHLRSRLLTDPHAGQAAGA